MVPFPVINGKITAVLCCIQTLFVKILKMSVRELLFYLHISLVLLPKYFHQKTIISSYYLEQFILMWFLTLVIVYISKIWVLITHRF